ncbi:MULTISPECIES: hypothetical protein [unclassified Variovorax]|uniref:hypothetical protein n=1 Tax=unclassified Variovorax TaxID=663243 RepID=UPI001316311C|nr:MULTISPECIES: hypothetical protein [unclassified Variovorax]VTU42884.1 hypothetical protein H6P1_00303 [Variovorax sp. PBL-H6]VTU43608.1 hypothetical protein SRS16P1_00601 [Variovorax sp. SRS16]VTU43670.1 hypothetical protein E5P1_00595 [Variovorax sp. PBL-E5]
MSPIATITAADDGGAHLQRSISDLLKIVRDQLKLEVLFVAESVGGNRVLRQVCAVVHGVGVHIRVPVQLPDGRLYGTLCGFNVAPSAHLDERHVRRLEMAAAAAARLLARAEGSDLYALDEHDVVTMPGVLL